jgi:hypothetical protein
MRNNIIRVQTGRGVPPIVTKNAPILQNKIIPGAGAFPQYPGQKAGLNVADVQNFNNVQAWKVKGFTFNLGAGSNTAQNIQISGTAWYLLGLSVHAKTFWNDDTATPNGVTLKINNENVIEEMPFDMLDIKYMNKMFFPFERYLNGADSVTINFDNSQGQQQVVECSFYYL